jgi:aspartyl protease family protein
MSTANIWAVAGLGLIGVALLSPTARHAEPAEAKAEAPAASAKPAATPARAGNGLAGREIARGGDGHFYAEAQVNGARIHFLVDTGASVVALTPADAQRAGIALPDERARARGAGGEIEVIPVTIDRIAIGPLEARAVRGAVADGLPVSLLGQSFLSQVGSVEIRGDVMVLR